LLRESNTVNKVSHPLKFVEYLYAGLNLIISRDIGDTQDLVIKNNFGVVLDTLDEAEFLQKYEMLENQLTARDPAAIIDFARSEFDLFTSCEQYKMTYKKLIETNYN
jgi:hypothetical protein